MRTPSQLNVLVVDDNEHARRRATNLLREYGVGHIAEASDGSDAVIMLRSQPYDLVLLDWYMPEVSGAGVLRIVKAPGSGPNQNTEFVVMTAYATRENVENARILGVREVLVKPLESRSIAACLKRILSANEPADDPEASEPDAYFI